MSFPDKNRAFEIALAVYLVLMFMALGLDLPGFLLIRIVTGGVLIFSLLIFLFKTNQSLVFICPSVWAFGAFLGFQGIRLVAGVLQKNSLGEGLLEGYLMGPLWWSLPFAFLWLCTALLYSKKGNTFFAYVLAFCGFVISLSLIPNLLSHGNGAIYHQDAQGNARFLPEFLTAIEWIPKYLLAPHTHPNLLGDLISFGCFASLGLGFYAFQEYRDPERKQSGFRLFRKILVLLLAGFIMGAAILLLFSRGTILFFGLGLMVYFLLLAIKFPSKIQTGVILGMAAAALAFFLWAGNLDKAWKELQTLNREKEVLEKNLEYETDVYKSRSIYHNKEGIRIAKAIAQDYPLWGIGARQYVQHSAAYVPENRSKEEFLFARAYALNHYFQKIAEEGMGAWLYFIFLGTYILEMLWKLFRTQSRFKFIVGLSLFMPVMVVLGHAAINDLMDHYTVSMIVFMVMGASLGVLRKDFQHA